MHVECILVDVDGAVTTGGVDEVAVGDDGTDSDKFLHDLWIIHVGIRPMT
jgi:hypothetical protein